MPRPKIILSEVGGIPPARRRTMVHRFLPALPPTNTWLKGFVVGKRFHSAAVIRLADAKPVHLGRVVKADGRFRIFAFAGTDDRAAAGSAVRRLCDFLAEDQESSIRKYTRRGEDIDAVIDVRAIFQQAHRQLAIETMPPLLLPHKGCYGLRDYEKIFCSDVESSNDIFSMRRIDREVGCMIIVRPDQYVAHVLPLNGYEALTLYFARFMVPEPDHDTLSMAAT